MLLEVPDGDNFTIILKQRAKLDVNTSIGLMPITAELKDIDVAYDHPEQGYFLDVTDGRLYGQDGTSRKESGVFPGTLGLAEGQVLRLQYCRNPAPRLSGSVAGADFVELKFASPIPALDYYPCILLFKTTCIQVAVDKPQKRLCTALARMWDDRNFTDAEIVCSGTVFPVHRAVLAAESPVFAAAFTGQMQEASTCRLDIKDASAEATEALLKYIYTGQLDLKLAADVLPLAHCYQLLQLAHRCGEQMLETVTSENVVCVMRALRALREDVYMAPLWKRALLKLDDDKALRHAALEGL